MVATKSLILDCADMSQGVNLRFVGIHLAGANTRRSSVVRAFANIKEFTSVLQSQSPEEVRLNKYIQSKFQKLSLVHADEERARTSTPLFWEAFSPEIGPTAQKDSDLRLLEVIEDLGKVDVFCIDAPLTLPPCLSCECEKSDGLGCKTREVELMRHEWEERKKETHKTKMKPLLPYVDRFFEVHARRVFDHPQLSMGFEFDAVLSSGRAPLSARAIKFAKEIERRFPSAIILETNSAAGLFGWAYHVGYEVNRTLDLRHGNEGRAMRTGLLRKLEQARIATRSATVYEGFEADLCSQHESFVAAMAALSGWGFFNGLIHMTPEFVTLNSQNPLRGWACIPKDIAWQSQREH